MKKIFTIVLLLAVMSGAMAQNQGTREYVSALITFNDTNMLPQDTLNKYGVVLQTRSGRMANGLIDASKYQMFLNSNLVERVQPSTRVYLRDEQVNGHQCSGKCDHHKGNRGDVRTDLIPQQDILDDEARGCFLGFMLGGTNNRLDVSYARNAGTWYADRGVDFEVVTGYQFNQWFGIRTGLGVLTKNYITDLEINYIDINDVYRTYYRDVYLQLPLLADLSVGGEDVRVHFMFGGFAAYWLSQWRHGYVYVADDPRPFVGDAYHFVEGYDNRFDAGVAGGIGLSLKVSPAWQLHFEGDYYHGLISTAKNPYKTYNRTWTFGMGATYHF
ncbi:MAG: PorT family protein [Bacteroidales bacterium]|nr:PorT family protein [Bacteroidales bacterium]